MKPKLTIFTPTYNRAHTLHLGYEALLRQTCTDFVWLIVDDGSTDQTRELVTGWMQEKKVSIRYHYQENQGVHVAHNTAYRLMDTELWVNVDSDDQLTDDAVEQIIACWEKADQAKLAGIIGLNQTYQGKITESRLPEDRPYTTLTDFYYRLGGKGDKTLVYRTDLVKRYPPFPVFEGEKFFPLSHLYYQIDQDYSLWILNRPLKKIEYHSDGLSANIYLQYWNNPRGFAYYRIQEMKVAPTFKRLATVCVHYVASCIRSRDKRWLSNSPCKGLTCLCAPFGALLYLFIRHKVKNNRKYQVKY